MNKSIKFVLNNMQIETSCPQGMVTLDFIRNKQGLHGTKEGCKEGECGACTVLCGEIKNGVLRYKAVASCLLPLGELEGKHIVTIEGLNMKDLTPIQEAIVGEGATQCGFCTPGIVVSLTGFFLTSVHLDYDDAIDSLDGNICRCTGYVSINKACDLLSSKYKKLLNKKNDRIKQLVNWQILPQYFLEIPDKLNSIIYKKDKQENIQKEIIVGGGTDLFVQKPLELLDANIDFISHHNFDSIKKENNKLYIGGAVTIEELKTSPIMQQYFPSIKQYLNLISSTIMRNKATVAGNIVNASPIGDMCVFFIALNAKLGLINKKIERTVLLKDFFKGYKKLDLKNGEIIQWIIFDPPDKGSFFNFEKVSQRRYLDIASCNSAIYLNYKKNVITDIHISAGGVSPIPLYLEKTSKYLNTKEVTVENIKNACRIATEEVSPISDVRGSADYKKLLLKQIIYAHFIKFSPDKIKFEELI